MIGWILCKKEVEIKAFKKVFRIPDVVDLERIKAKYNEEESTLRIIMKKKVKGICGVGLEEEKEEEEPKMIKEEVPKEVVVEKKEAKDEIYADKDLIEGAAMEEKRKKAKLRKPLMFAGSAFLVSLIVLVINLLRARKR